ncbi:MAG: hypothetical protein JXA66_03970 [Oligoflexia bacterium]|nr:hypothetical protein [Oligoflexia bacterium]
MKLYYKELQRTCSIVSGRDWREMLSRTAKNSRMVFLYDKNVRNTELFSISNSVLLQKNEKKKNIVLLNKTITELNNFECAKDSLIVAVGDAYTADITGMVASGYLGGLEWIYIPYDFEAMADPFMGGRLSSESGKNIYERVYLPRSIILDHDLILHGRNKNMLFGIFPLVRTSFLYSERLFNRLETKWMDIFLRKEDIIREFIIPSILRNPVKINRFPLGNAIEWASGYGIEHGIAVAFALEIELRIAKMSAFVDDEVFNRVSRLLNSIYSYFRNINIFREKFAGIKFPDIYSCLKRYMLPGKAIPVWVPKKIGRVLQRPLMVSESLFEKAFGDFAKEVENDIGSAG